MKNYVKAQVVAKNNPEVNFAAGCPAKDHASVAACNYCKVNY